VQISYIQKIKKRFDKFFIVVLVSLLNFYFRSGSKKAINEQIKDLTNTGIIGLTHDVNFSHLYNDWQKGMQLATEGHYFESNEIFEHCLLNAYQLNGVDPKKHTPRFLSYGFSHAIGHRALIGLLLSAQEIGLIPSENRIIPTRGGQDKKQLDILFGRNKKLEIVEFAFGYRFLEPPTLWHQSERVMMINGGHKFLPTPEFIEETYSKINQIQDYNHVILENEYIKVAEKELLSLGLPREVPFVVIHVRKKSWHDDTRQADILNYKLAVQHLIARGIWVIQIGTDNQNILIEDKNFLAIQGDDSAAFFLTPYLLYKCKFFINTCSGPTYLAPLFGTPVLQTNVIAVGKNTTTLSKNSMHLPKNWVYKDRKVSFSELLKSPEGYSDPGMNYLKKRGYTLIENSSEEILAATLDMENLLDNNFRVLDYDSVIQEIREANNAPAKGLICTSYIENNKNWFLN
jgi:putative glycosyltransferase (TIGR04372 family)